MKKIFITPKIIKDKYNQINTSLDTAWFNYISKLNYIGFSSYFSCKKRIKLISDIFDGLILSGGGDISDIKKNNINKLRDTFELEIFRHFLKKNKPILCICRGFQLISKKFNNKIVQLKNHTDCTHKIYNINESIFFDTKILNTNSYHDYSIKNLNNKFEIIYISKDGSIEIAKMKKFKVYCFMFHPERNNINQAAIDKLVKKIFR